MKLIVGLGNPGESYSRTRHSTGVILLNQLVDTKDLTWENSTKLKAKIAKKDDYIFLKPMEFMNSSGISVSLAVNFYKIDLKDLVVIHDDVDLPFGEVRKQFASGSAGHKGVESIISNLGTKEFWRIRVGIGRPVDAQPVDEFVLRDFSEEELEKIKKIDTGSLI